MLTPFKFSTKHLQRGRDAIRRRLTRFLLDRAPQAHVLPEKRIVFVRWDGKLGDSIVLSWVYRALSIHRPDFKVTVITHADLVSMHRQDFGVEDVLVCRKRPGWFELWRLARQVKHADFVVHLTESFKPRDFWFIRCVAPSHVVGLDDDVQSVDIKLGAVTRQRHFSEKLLPWLASLGVEHPDRHYIVPKADEAWSRLRSAWPTGRVIGFCPAGAGHRRQLSSGRIRELLACMRLESNAVIMMLVSREQAASLQPLIDELEDPNVQLMPASGGLSGLFAAIRHCDVIVSVDTAVVHIASGLDKPLLALYNPDASGEGNFLSWHPNSKAAIAITANVIPDQHIDAIDTQEFRQAYRLLLSRLQ